MTVVKMRPVRGISGAEPAGNDLADDAIAVTAAVVV